MNKSQLKHLAKIGLSLLYNGHNIVRFNKVKIPFYLGRGLIVHNPKGINIGKSVTIGRYSRLSCYGKGGIYIHDNCYIGQNFSALSGGPLIIKENTLIASYVTILSENHSINPECGITYGQQPLIENKTQIGNNCWIGERVIILSGCSIGDWSIIGAGSIVTRNIPPYSIAVGNPAKIIKQYDFESNEWVKISDL